MDQATRTTSRTLVSILAIAAIVALTGAQSSCRERSTSFSESRSSAQSGGSSSVVKYSVSSNASIESVSFIGDDGRTKSDSSVGRSWSAQGPAKHGTVRVSATTSRDGAWIKCSVTVKGEVVQQASAQGGAGTRVVCETSY